MRHLTLSLVCLAALAGAEDPHAGHGHGPGDDHDHDHGPAHASASAAAAADGHDHGRTEPLGSLRLGAWQVAARAAAHPAPGAAWYLELRLDPANPAPRAIRCWVGVQNGRGSAKARAAAAGAAWAAHVEVPATLPADAALWISVEPEQGEALTGRLALAP